MRWGRRAARSGTTDDRGIAAPERPAFGGSRVKSGKAILVVGASLERRVRIAALVAQAGHALAELDDLQAAPAWVADECPPLVVMESSDEAVAREVCRRIREACGHTFILRVAERVNEEVAFDPEADDLVDAFLADPVDPREMVALVRSLLRLQRAEAELSASEERLQLAQESAGLAILDWTIPTNSFVHSDNFAELFELPPRSAGGTLDAVTILDRIHPADVEFLVRDFSADSRTSGAFHKEFRVRRRDGGVRWIASRGRFFTDAGGKPQRMLSLSFDNTARKLAERANAELAAIVASSSDAIVSVDNTGNVTSWNAGAERLFEIAPAQMIGRPLAVALSGTTAEEREAYGRQLLGGENSEIETRQLRRDGTPIDIWVTSAPIKGDDGAVIGASLVIRDVSAHRKREDHVRFLMRELTHRSKNLLAVIQAMARQSMAKDLSPEEFVRRFTDRLQGLAGSHDLLSAVEYKGASLLALIRSQLSHYDELFGTRILLEGVDLTLRAEAAQNIGIALHELSTNAAKYGALSNDAGTVTVVWEIVADAPRILRLSWQERGGPPVVAPTRRGFGRVVMDRITGQALDGKSEIRFEPDGVVWSLVAPTRSTLVE